MSAVNDYLAALDRMINGCPQIVPVGCAINNDAVALEAGRKRGSIKKKRYPDLCRAIDEAAERQQLKVADSLSSTTLEHVSSTGKGLQKQYKALEKDYHVALQKNISLVYEVFTLKKKVDELEKKTNVLNFPKLR
ncbi:hypothetical protein [Pseudomonas sp. DWRC2-2]|uniref:hypothetical protein n=1 Tax=Pseudomonas sp. DWRC2-2 TaxID=2804567 RepID=UPI003CF5C7DD